MRKTKRRKFCYFGTHGASARGFIERGGERIRVQWRQQGALKTQSWPNTPENQAEARAFAETIAQELNEAKAPRARLTVRELWQRHADAEFDRLRPRTCVLRSADWRKWEVFVGREAIAEDLGRDKLAEFRSDLETRLHLGVNTIREAIKSVKLVYAWGLEHEVLRRDRLAPYRYKVAKDKRPAPVEEFRLAEFHALLRAVPLDDGRTWRAHGVLAVCGYQGARQWSVLHLRKSDIDLEQGMITWRAEWDKNGVTWVQPMRPQTREVLAVCFRRAGESAWVFPASSSRNRNPVYTAQSLWCALKQAERRADITHKRNRGAHGLRRLLAGEVMALTGNVKDAADAIGDKIGVMQRYLVRREDRVREVFEALDTPKAELKPQRGREVSHNRGGGQAVRERARQDSNLRPTDSTDTQDAGVIPPSLYKKPENPASPAPSDPETATQTVTETGFSGATRVAGRTPGGQP